MSAAGPDPEKAHSKAMRRELRVVVVVVVVVSWLLSTDVRLIGPRLKEAPDSSRRKVGARVTVSGMEMLSAPDVKRGIHHQQGLLVCIGA